MQILIVPAVAVRAGGLVYPGEMRVVGYKEHAQEVCRLGSLLECAQGDLNQAMKIIDYDEAKERELFESYALEVLGPYFMKPQDCLTRSGGTYTYGQPATAWCAWQASAKSRSGTAS